ncbi:MULTISPECIES: FKBP-type peptidyl-prolyl cis-trans isomerase [Proteiniphilum]|jgi:peptidylprolyl isomerase/FKBP-type peptidyl-prolyl cis-trans isomerase FklB|uniref:FKBP-type peptidyl-prolyl cis-trans isomerase n=2 Tax=Dysgonomonadaceae TaxID=2005520 RepID=UPI001EEC5ADD|nr:MULTISPECIES: FKBP-type peptidyl-prolyl cis-trans isomerase [Proteiniphilum]ULB34024.1 FKBP-type peptidyl-prolyl cis-trans isomerase [Proteiniphilum propionicum]
MKMYSTIFIILSAAILFTSCDKTETFDDKWKLDNEAQFALITNDARYKKINSQSGKGFIMQKEIESGDGATPYFTDRVEVLYTGWYKRDWSKSDTYKDDKGNIIYNKVIFDSTANRNNIPSKFQIKELVDGFSTALQHMKVGDKWEIWIPWYMGYGEISSGTIPAYTTLVFEIELVSIL